jgi:hypothetical protein
VNVHTNAAIVVENSMPHSFRQIRNLTERNCRGTFINFSIVDSRYPLNLDSSQICLCYSDQIWNLFNEFSLTLLSKQQVPYMVIKKILSILHLEKLYQTESD